VSEFETLLKSINSHTDELQAMAEALLHIVSIHRPQDDPATTCTSCPKGTLYPCATIIAIIEALEI
jgi:hypothetical protein